MADRPVTDAEVVARVGRGGAGDLAREPRLCRDPA